MGLVGLPIIPLFTLLFDLTPPKSTFTPVAAAEEGITKAGGGERGGVGFLLGEEEGEGGDGEPGGRGASGLRTARRS